MTDRDQALAAVAAVWRIESAAVTAALARRTGDLALAEDLAQDAVAAAVEQWPRDGMPAQPGAWLMTVAQRRLADHARRRETERRKLQAIADETTRGGEGMTQLDAGYDIDDPFTADPQDELRLFFLCCHPALTPESQIALTLRCIAGLSSEAVAKAFLVPTPTMQARLTRAKKALPQGANGFALPPVAQLGVRLGAVLAVVYAIFTEGHAATSGHELTRAELCHDALRLARRLTRLAPTESEVHALAALLELQASRLPARTAADGTAVLLEDQDRGRWDHALIARGLAALATARGLVSEVPGPYLVQAEIAACHARAARAEDTDWDRIVELYAELQRRMPSPVVALVQAVAVGRAVGPEAALPLLHHLDAEGALAAYPYLSAALADCHERLGDRDQARHYYLRAADLAGDTPLATTLRAAADAADRRTVADGSGVPED